MARWHEKVQAVVLSRRKIGEADLAVTLFTREHGLLKATAKGARKIPSRRGAHLEPFAPVTAVVSGNPRRYVLAVEPAEDVSPVTLDDESRRHATQLAQVIRGLFPEGEAHESVYDAFTHAVAVFPSVDATKRHLAEMAVTLLALNQAGVAPQLARCGVCSKQIPEEAVTLDANAGGWRCLSCHESFAGTGLSIQPELVKVVKWLARNPEGALKLRLDENRSSQLLASLRAYARGVASVPLSPFHSPLSI